MYVSRAQTARIEHVRYVAFNFNIKTKIKCEIQSKIMHLYVKAWESRKVTIFLKQRQNKIRLRIKFIKII